MKINKWTWFDRLNTLEAYRAWPQIYDGATDRHFTVIDANITSRVLSHWSDKKLLFDDFREHQWRLFDLTGLVWLSSIKVMRSYGIPLETIKKVKDELQPENLTDEILKTPEIRELLTNLASAEGQELPDLEELLSQPEVREEVRKALPNYLKALVLYALITKDYVAILINQDGQILPYLEDFREEYLTSPSMVDFFKKSFLTVSISETLVQFSQSYDLDFLSEHMGLMTPEEVIVLKTIRQPGIKSVLVKLHNQGEFDLIEVTREQKIDRSARLYEIMLQDGYEDITIKTKRGEIVYCQNVTRIRYNKLGTG